MFKNFGKKIIRKLFKKHFNKYQKISFSQSGEDLIIDFIFKLRGITKPTYIDIGAHHPYLISNTALFYRRGSHGINIEPDPFLFKEFIEERKRDINLNIGISNQPGKEDFFIFSSRSLNTFSKEEAEKYQLEGNFRIEEVKQIKVNTIQNIIKDYANNKFPHFLNIDAEGMDEIIIKQIDFKTNYPIVICVETISFSANGNGVKNKNLINYILENGYINYADTNINTIFVKEEFWRKNPL